MDKMTKLAVAVRAIDLNAVAKGGQTNSMESHWVIPEGVWFIFYKKDQLKQQELWVSKLRTWRKR